MKRSVNVPDVRFNTVFSVSEYNGIQVECGGKKIRRETFIQTTPLLPIDNQLDIPSFPSQPGQKPKILPLIKNQLDNSDKDLIAVEPKYKYEGQIFLKNNFSLLKEQYFQGNHPKPGRYFGHHFNLIKMESCGKENLFNGSCVKIMDDKVIYTGNDGFLRIGLLDESFQKIIKHFQNTDISFGLSRIYSLDVRKTDSTSYLIAARYQTGVAYFTFDGFDLINTTRFETESDCCSHAFLNTSQAVLLDAEFNLSHVELNTGKVLRRKSVKQGSEHYSWGILSQGRGFNNICVGSRKQVSLVDIRSDNMYTVRQIDEEENEYIRDIKTLSPYLYVTTDQYVTVYDVRNTNNSLQSVSLNYMPNSIVGSTDVLNLDGEHVCLTTTERGEIGLSLLDYSHKSCSAYKPFDASIMYKCNSSNWKEPDIVSCDNELQKGWPHTVQASRLHCGVWLENSVENRHKIPFRGGSLYSLSTKENNLGAVLVNAVGDLFFTEFKKIDLEKKLSADKHEDLITKEDYTRLEDWGEKIYRSTPLKTAYVKDILYKENEIENNKETKYGMPTLQLQENQDLDVRIKGLKLHLEPDDPEVMTNGFSRINRVLEKDIVEYEDGQNDITYNNAKYPEDSVSRKVMGIMLQDGYLDPKLEYDDDELVKIKQEMMNSGEVKMEPGSQQPDLMDFLSDLGFAGH